MSITIAYRQMSVLYYCRHGFEREMSMKPNPDDRSDNVKKIQKHINHTIRNMELAEEMIAKTDDPNQRQALIEKNKRREQALEGFRNEIREEAKALKKDHD